MDTAASIAKVAIGKLIACKDAYVELTLVCDDLTMILETLQHLAHERGKELRLAGPIQNNLVQHLSGLNEELTLIVEKKSTKGGKAALFFGSCISKGASGHVESLSIRRDRLEKLLTIVQAEAANVSASTGEEMAGGAAGKHIAHEGLREFWREQFKNEFHLSWGQFREGLMKYEQELTELFENRLHDVLHLLRYTLDTSRDGDVSVREFATLLNTEHAISNRLDVLDVVKHHFTATKKLLPALAMYHSQQVTAMDVYHNLVATIDKGGILKISQITAEQICEVSREVFHNRWEGSAIKFWKMKETGKLYLIVTGESWMRFLDVWEEKVVLKTLGQAGGTLSISTENSTVFCSPFSFSSRSVFVKRIDATESGLNVATLTHLQIGSATRQMIPLGDNQHIAISTFDRGVYIFNYTNGHQIHRISAPFQKGIATVPGASGRLVVFFEKEDVIYTDILNNPEAAERVPSSVAMNDETQGAASSGKTEGFTYCPLASIGDEYAVMFSNSLSSLMLFPRATKKKKILSTIPLPSSLTVNMIHISHSGVVVAANLQKTPVLLVVNPYDGSLRGILGDRIWSGHTSIPFNNQHHTWLANTKEAFPINDGHGAFFTTGRGHQIHLWSSEGELIHQQNIQLGAPFSTSICRIAQHGDTVCVITADAMVLTYDFSGPYDENDRVGNLEVEATEVKYLLENLASNARHDATFAVRTFLDTISRLSVTTRPKVKSAITDLQLKTKVKFSQEDVTKVQDALAGLKVQIEQLREKDQNSHVYDPRRTKHRLNRFCIARRWMNPIAIRALLNGVTTCPTCSADLQKAELIQQQCCVCVGARTQCQACQAPFPKPTAYPLCDGCYDVKKEALRYNAGAVTLTSTGYLFLGAMPLDNRFYYGPSSTLFKLDAKTLKVLAEESYYYIPAFNNVVSSRALGGIVAASTSYDGVTIFDANSKGCLKESAIAEVGIIGTVGCISFNESRCYDDSAEMLTSTLSGEVRVTVLTQGPSAASPIVATKKFSVSVPGVYAAAMVKGILVLGSKAGSLMCRSETDPNTNFLEYQGHNGTRISTCFCTKHRIYTYSTGGIVNMVPTLFLKQLASLRFGELEAQNTFGGVASPIGHQPSSAFVGSSVYLHPNYRGHKKVINRSWQMLIKKNWVPFDRGVLLDDCFPPASSSEADGESTTAMKPFKLRDPHFNTLDGKVNQMGAINVYDLGLNEKPTKLLQVKEIRGEVREAPSSTENDKGDTGGGESHVVDLIGLGNTMKLPVGEVVRLKFPQLPTLLTDVGIQNDDDLQNIPAAHIVATPRTTATGPTPTGDTPAEQPTSPLLQTTLSGKIEHPVLLLSLRIFSGREVSGIAVGNDLRPLQNPATPLLMDRNTTTLSVPFTALEENRTTIPIHAVGDAAQGGYVTIGAKPQIHEGFGGETEPCLFLIAPTDK